MKTVIFRTDGGNSYGLAMGHVYRCKRLAQYLVARGYFCRFIMRGDNAGSHMISHHGFGLDIIPETLSEAQADRITITSAMQNDAILFIDLPQPSTMLVDRAARANVFIAVYEDRCSPEIEPDLLINPTPYPMDYNTHSRRTQYFLGTDYLVINPDVSNEPPIKFYPDVERLFINFGGADPCNITSRVLRILLFLRRKMEILLLTGPAFGHREEVNRILSSLDIDRRVTVFEASKTPTDIQRRCHAAISAGGTTIYELCALSIPTLVLPTIEHERRLTIHLDKKGWVDGLPKDVNHVSDAILEKKMLGFLSDPKRRHGIYRKIKNSSFDHGLSRVCEILMDRIEISA